MREKEEVSGLMVTGRENGGGSAPNKKGQLNELPLWIRGA